MRNSQITMKCFSCGQNHAVDEMRCSPKNPDKLMCKPCIARVKTTLDSKTVSKVPKEDVKVKYTCDNCRYTFTRASRIDLDSCPYCGKSGTLEKHGSNKSILKKDFDCDYIA